MTTAIQPSLKKKRTKLYTNMNFISIFNYLIQLIQCFPNAGDILLSVNSVQLIKEQRKNRKESY